MSKRTPSTQAQAAKAIRADLKRHFPQTTFRVTSRSFSMGDAVDITWTDGPTTSQVDALTNQYQYGSFDGMIDLYENTNSRNDIPQVKYVQTQRNYSAERRAEAVAHVNARYAHEGADLKIDIDGCIANDYVQIFGDWGSTHVHRAMQPQSLTCTCGTNPQIGDVYCSECGTPLQDDERRAQEYEREEAQEAGVDALLGSLLTN